MTVDDLDDVRQEIVETVRRFVAPGGRSRRRRLERDDRFRVDMVKSASSARSA